MEIKISAQFRSLFNNLKKCRKYIIFYCFIFNIKKKYRDKSDELLKKIKNKRYR